MHTNNIILGFDFGLKNIGIAVGQQLTCTAQPITTLKAKTGRPNWYEIKKILVEWQPITLIVGLPINVNGTEQPFTAITRKFSVILHKKSKLKVIMYDERFSTIEARANLFKYHGYRGLKTNKINSISAVIILESWLRNNHIYT